MAEKFWQDETDPKELRRRAEDLRRDGLWAAAQQLEDRARQFDFEPNTETQ